MNLTYLKNALQNLIDKKLISVKENSNLSEYSSFRIGGPSDLLIHPQSIDGLLELIKQLRASNYPYAVFGNASNILFSDKGYRGAAVFTTEMQNYSVNDNSITANAGMSFTLLSVKARDHHLCGLEFAYGIPGTVGGAIYMNAGAYGGSVSDHLVSSVAYDPRNDSVYTLSGSDKHQFGYRHSCYMENNHIILSGEFSLNNGDSVEITAKMKELMNSRRTKQPLEYPSAGSVFKRPEGYFAGKLIEDAGLKGYRIGDAQVSDKHAGFIVNRGMATADDVLRLIDHIQNEVYTQFGVRLETEIIYQDETGKAGI